MSLHICNGEYVAPPPGIGHLPGIKLIGVDMVEFGFHHLLDHIFQLVDRSSG